MARSCYFCFRGFNNSLFLCAMFNKLKTKWRVGLLRLLLILCVFAIGGSLTGIVGRKIMGLSTVEHPVAWALLYILLVTICWPLLVLLVSIPFGQFAFFRNYLRRLWNRMTGRTAVKTAENQMNTIRLAIFASGAGSNAAKIIDHFTSHPQVKIVLVVSNKPEAGVIAIANRHQIPVLLMEKERFFRGDAYLPAFEQAKIDYIILAGFLWKVPAGLIAHFPSRIINIHPALLPKYGGKGMYGHFVHEAVIAAGEKESGITIHFVDEQYDHNAAIYQGRCPVEPSDTPDSLAARIHQLEHEAYPRVIEKTVLGDN